MRRLLLGTLFLATPATIRAQAPAYQVSAVRYAEVVAFPVSGLVAGADTSRRMDIAMMVWLVTGDGRRVLVDAGFYRDKFLERWRPRDYRSPAAAVAAAGVRAEDITDVIVTHAHWDHLDGVDLFPNARVWIQEEEYAYYVNDDGTPKNRGVDPDNAAALRALRQEGRLWLVAGDSREILPGITCYTGGRHTYASQYVGVRTAGGTVVLASDNLYLYENLDRHIPIAQTFDAAANLAAQDRMRTIASDSRLIVPGHDPAVFERFPVFMPNVATIR
jgi:glyoxylase-like metal-dependent hydrolase (beta-lactamase superfamily II)